MHISQILIENFRIFGEGKDKLVLPLNAGLTALVGENDEGKSAIIDAIRFVLGTKDQYYSRIEDDDFYRRVNNEGTNESPNQQKTFGFSVNFLIYPPLIKVHLQSI